MDVLISKIMEFKKLEEYNAHKNNKLEKHMVKWHKIEECFRMS